MDEINVERKTSIFCFRDIGAEDLTNELYIPDKAERVDFSRNQVQHEEINQIKSNESNHL